MNKKIIGIIVIAAVLLGGCNVFTKFQEAKDQYLETRVADLMEEMPAEEEVVEETEDTMVEETEVVEETEDSETKEAEATEEPEMEPTEEPETTAEPEKTTAPTATPTVASTDPAVYLGTPTWSDTFDKVEFWLLGVDDYTSAALENGKMKLVAQTEEPGWRIAATPALAKAYIEATFAVEKCSETDRYGLYFRVPKTSNYNQGYIFSVTCDGRYSVRKWDGLVGQSGQSTWIKGYTASGAINKGINQGNRLGVMTLGDRMLLYINGVKVDEVADASFSEGNFGVVINRDRTANLTVFVDDARYWLDPVEK